MKRITPEEVLEAYEKTGLKPMQGDYFSQDGCACGLGVFYSANSGNEDERQLEAFYELSFSGDYAVGFADGFDNEEKKKYWGEKAITGYEDGKAAWESVKHLAEVAT